MKNKNPNRNKYLSYSHSLFRWVEDLGFSQSFFGRFVSYLEGKLGVKRLLGVILFSFVISIFINFEMGGTYKLKEGQLAPGEIKSPMSFSIVDEKLTQIELIEAENSMSPVFDYYPQAYVKLFKDLNAAFSNMRDFLSRGQANAESLYNRKSKFESLLGSEVSQDLFDWLIENQFSFQIENIIFRSLSVWSKQMIYDSSSLLSDKIENVSVKNRGRGESTATTYSLESLVDLRKKKNFKIETMRGYDRFSERSKNNIKLMTYSLLVPNLIFNLAESQEKIKKARAAVEPIKISVKRNQLILSKDEVVKPSHIKILNQIRKIKSGPQMFLRILFSALFFFTIIVVFLSYVKRFTVNKVNIKPKELAIMGAVALVSLGIVKLFLFITEASFYNLTGQVIPSSFFLYLTPLAMAPMLAGLLLSSGELVWLFTLFFMTALSLMLDFNFSIFVMGISAGVAAARGVFSCEKRNDVYFAGIRSGLIAAIVVLFIGLLERVQVAVPMTDILWTCLGAFLGGIFSAMFTLTLIPVLESFFNCTTDVKLLELSNLSHPLMKEMIMKSPGTYHHALAVGNMVEEAANKIEANALLAKVMAYYHDIGKIEHSHYFIENQRPGLNPHEEISPYMSKTVIIAHVKDGAELAIKHKLGRPIVDGILQHHGTTLISYFYNKALQQSGYGDVEEVEFRYPGPKPQFKEAALVMLADSIEAAARSIEEPTPPKLTALVQSIIQSKFIDGQLNECNLTFKELSLIEETFKKTILNIYHHRIDYPERENKKSESMPDVLNFKKKKTTKK